MPRKSTQPATPRRTSPASRGGTTALHPTKNDLPEATRREVIALLNQRLASSIDLQTQCKQAHWNVKGPNFTQSSREIDKFLWFIKAHLEPGK